MSRNFRFPRLTILLMLLVLVGIFVAIEKARDVQLQYTTSSDVARLPAAFVTVFAMTVVVGAAAYAISFAMKRSGIHRLSDVKTPRSK